MSIYNGWCDVEVVTGNSITLRVPGDVNVKPGKIVMLLYETDNVPKRTSVLNKTMEFVVSAERDEMGTKFKKALEQSARDIGFMVQNVPVDVLGKALEIYNQEIADDPVREIREASRRG